MMVSFFSLILIAAIVIGIGIGALALLSLVINALSGRSNTNPGEKVGAWSGFKSALGISTGLVAIFLVAGTFFLVRVRPSSHSAIANEQTYLSPANQADGNTAIQSALASYSEASGSAKPAIEVAVEVKDRSKVSISVDTSDKATNQREIPQDTSSPDAAVDTASKDAAERRKVQLEEMFTEIGEFLRSQLGKVGETSVATPFGQAAKSDNGDVVIYQPSDEALQTILGAGGQDLLRSLNSELPGRIRQTYALIPLTPPIGTTVPMKPMIAKRGLEIIANSIFTLVEHADAANAAAKPEPTPLTAEADGTLSVAPETRPEPEWMSKIEGRRVIAKSKPVLPGDDPKVKLAEAINEALAKHVEAVAASMNPTMLGQAKHIHMELPQAIASKYIVDEYERPESMESEVGGKTSFQVLYALVEFPDTIDQIAVQQIRKSVQRDRIIGLAVTVGLLWFSVCSAGFGIRQWQKGTKLRRIAATPVFAMITISTLLLTIAMVFSLAHGEVPRGPWNETPVTIDLANM